MRWLRRLRWFYYWRRYGVCPDHLTLARPGGGYEPKWICPQCDEENRYKHEHRESNYHLKRVKICDMLNRGK